MLHKIKTYGKEFLSDESGMELLQFALLVCVTIILLGVLMLIVNAIKKGLEGAATKVQEGFDKADIHFDLTDE